MIRPGRVDVKEKIGYVSPYQLEQLFMRFYPGQSAERAAAFSRAVTSGGAEVSAAQVQGFFMLYKTDPDAMLADVHRISTV